MEFFCAAVGRLSAGLSFTEECYTSQFVAQSNYSVPLFVSETCTGFICEQSDAVTSSSDIVK